MTPDRMLKLWLENNDMTQMALSEMLEVHRSAVTYYVKGRRRPLPEIASRIDALTNGAVPAHVWEAPKRFGSKASDPARAVQ